MCRLQKNSYSWLPRKCDYRTDGRTDRRRTKWSLCAAMLCRRHKNCVAIFKKIMLKSSIFKPPPLLRRRGKLLYVDYKLVCHSLGRSLTAASYNLERLTPIDIKLGTLIHINLQIIPFALWVKVKANFRLCCLWGICVLQKLLVYMCFGDLRTENVTSARLHG